MKRQSFAQEGRGGGGTEFRQGLRIENGTANRLLSLIILWNVKASARSAGVGNLNSDEDSEARTVIRIFNDLMKRKSFRASRGMEGKLNSDEDYFRERYNESSSFSNDLMKIKNFRASRGRGEPEFRRGLRVENCTANRLLSLITLWNLKASALRAGRGGGPEFGRGLRVENCTTNRLLSNDLMKRKSFRASRGRRGGGGNWIQTRIKSRERYNESSSFSHDLWNLKASALRAGGGGGDLNSDED